MVSFKNKAKKYVKKQVKRGAAFAKKRYTKSGAPLGLNVGQIARDVMALKKLVNAEKKRTELGGAAYEMTSTVLGQVRNNISGHQSIDITPSSIAQGNNYNERSGNSIKLHSLVIKGQLFQQTNTSQRIRYSIEVYQRKTDTVSAGVLDLELYSPNPFTVPQVLDYNSVRNPDFFKDYIRLGYRNGVVSADTVNPQNSVCSNYTIPIKFNRSTHAKWDKSGTFESPQIFMFLRTDCGNAGTAVSTITNISVSGLETGLRHMCQWQYFYYDN